MPKEQLTKFVPPPAEQEKDQSVVVTKRKRSGPIPGGRSVDRVIQYKERRGGMAFTLRVHFDQERTADADKWRLIDELKKIVRKLEL